MISREVKVYKSSNFDKIKEDEFIYWQSKAPIERLAAVEQLRQESINQLIYQHKSDKSNERNITGLQRSVTVVSTK